MNSVFAICHCGAQKSNHPFKHPYESVITVKQFINKNFTEFIINASEYPPQEKIVCAKEQCIVDKESHKVRIDGVKSHLGEYTIFANHDFDPVILKYKNIRFAVPEKTRCNKCQVPLKEHGNKNTEKHTFETKITINGINKVDKLYVYDLEDDINIKLS